MIRLGLGVLVAGIAMFMWGFLYWAVLANPFTPLNAEGEAAVSQAIQTHITKPGLYMLPSPGNGTEAEVAARAKKGPYAMMHVAPGGVPFAEPSVLIAGFVHMLISAALLAVVLMLALPGASSMVDRLRVVGAVALVATVFINFAAPIWWFHDWGVTFVYAAYYLVALLIAGGILSFFIAKT